MNANTLCYFVYAATAISFAAGFGYCIACIKTGTRKNFEFPVAALLAFILPFLNQKIFTVGNGESTKTVSPTLTQCVDVFIAFALGCAVAVVVHEVKSKRH